MMAQRMVVQNTLDGLGGEDREGGMMIDCMESRLSGWIRPLIPKEHHLLLVQVTHSTAPTCACKGTHWECLRLPSGKPVMGIITERWRWGQCTVKSERLRVYIYIYIYNCFKLQLFTRITEINVLYSYVWQSWDFNNKSKNKAALMHCNINILHEFSGWTLDISPSVKKKVLYKSFPSSMCLSYTSNISSVEPHVYY